MLSLEKAGIPPESRAATAKLRGVHNLDEPIARLPSEQLPPASAPASTETTKKTSDEFDWKRCMKSSQRGS
jgi:hypothetical protein